MRKILIICVSFLVSSNAQEGGECFLEGVEPIQWTTSYKNDPVDDFEDTEFKRFKYKNIQDVEIKSGDYDHYFKARLENDELIISPTKAFEKYEEEQASTENPEINIRLQFKCTSGTRTLSFYQPIRDRNDYEPVFSEPLYSYNLPMPLIAGLDIARFGNPIVACDTDISNIRLDFSISPPGDFVASWGGPVDSTNKCHRAVVQTAKHLQLTSSQTYTITVTDIGNPTKSTTSELKIEIDEENTLPPNPHFDSAHYIATYKIENDVHGIDVGGPIRLKEGCSKVDLKLLGAYQNHFQVDCVSEEIKVKLVKPLLDEVLEKEPIVLLTIEAALELADESGRTVLVVYLPKQECPETTTEEPTTCASTEATTECPICTTEATTPFTCPPCTTESPTPPTECPSCSTTTEVECTTLESSPPTDCPTTSTECPLCPTTPEDCPSSPTECPISCPTTEPSTTPDESSSTPTECPVTCPDLPTECPPCTTTLVPPPETIIKFVQDNYRFEAKSWNVDFVIGFVKAVVLPDEPIEYSIEGDEDFLECNKKTGALKITKNIKIGIYNFVAFATGAKTGTKTKAAVEVAILEDNDNGEEGPTSINSLLIEHVLEEQEREITLPCKYAFCKYEIAEEYPVTNEKLFTFKNNNLHVAKIKRERKDIIGMLIPQFSLHLILKYGGSSPDKVERAINSAHVVTKRDVFAETNREWAFIPVKVPNQPDQLLISIIIDDINNNKPEFKIGKKLVVGYPTKDLALQLAPPYLAKVVATDIDAGENATIRYSSKSNHFVVHPETGVIYPGEDAFDDESNLEFLVTATDRNGVDDGLQLSTDLEIEVKPLKKENLIVLTVKNLMLEDIDDTMEDISEKTDITIKYLTAAVIPIDNTKNSLTKTPDNTIIQFFKSMLSSKAVSDHFSRIIVYGLDKKDKPVETDDLQEVLEDSEVLEDFTVDKWKPLDESGSGEDDNDNDDEDPSKVGYIVAISILASLLVIFLIAAAAFYYFKIYKTRKEEPYSSMEEEETNSVNFEKKPKLSLEHKYEDIPQRRPTGFVFNPPPIEEDEDEFGERTYEDTTDYSVPKDWIKKDEEEKIGENKGRFVDTTDDAYQYSERKLKSEDSPIDVDGDRRKSVKFKETVEKINIIVEDKQDDDILDERL